MIGYFPLLHKDELLYSVIARFHVHSGKLSFKATINELFGKSTMRAVIDFPCNLNDLGDKLVFNRLNSEVFIKDHTMFPLYQPFLPVERANIIKSKLKSGENNNIHAQIGVTANRIPAKSYLEYCPTCYQEEIEQYGEPYWHRVHQVPGVLVCPHHGCLLRNSIVKLPLSSQHEYVAAFYAVDITDGNRGMTYEEIFDKLFEIAKDLYWIINSDIPAQPINYYKEKYISALIHKNLATSTGRVKQKELVSSVKKFFSSKLLKILNCDIDSESENNWVHELVRKNRKAFHPLHHVLMMRFLFGSVENFFKGAEPNGPFGKGPWFCLNPSADHYLQRCVTEVTFSINSKSKNLIGRFSCSCGYIYTRNLQEGDELKKSRVLEFGPVWENAVQSMIKDGKSLTYISNALNTDIKVIKKHLTLIGEKKYLHTIIEDKEKQKQQNINLLIKREKWLQFQIENQTLSISELRAGSQDLYFWLYKNDKEWLYNHLPSRKVFSRNTVNVDWEKRDKVLLTELKKVVDNWNDEEKPIRKTKKSISKKVNRVVWVEKYAKKLPQSIEYLKSVTESVEDFQIRRVKIVIENLAKEDLFIKEWLVYKKAGLRPDISYRVKEVIAQEIEKHTQIVWKV
ncbi:TnsD family Tn7-like transposition protein [Bacillus coahuilensis]|uniref:TnsD family Tn7-like transposition protein n=1 Tax=Bacillus coahuilensis TaxID=408580 RepID=UPI0001850722|nr:TnsD family Tn7-like transposition protein [Bacillus coahuilensis]